MSDQGLVLSCSRDSFAVLTADGVKECRIKGKVLKSDLAYWNPLAPGDLVETEDDPHHPLMAKITRLVPRRNLFCRFNQKGQKPQILAANVDIVLVVCTPLAPPFRPRFIDRSLVQAEAAGIDAAVLCNKTDLAAGSGETDAELKRRLADYRRIGYPVLEISAATGEGMDALRESLRGKFAVLVGQSGVGKSSIVNVLCPESRLAVGALNEKYDRGNHTTTRGRLFFIEDIGARIIDTPGIRRFAPEGIAPEDLILYMKELAPLAGKCAYGLSCSHVGESGCAVRAALASGELLEERYESYLRIREELEGKEAYPDYD